MTQHLRQPDSDWEYAVAAADLMVGWQRNAAQGEDSRFLEANARSVVMLLAAAVYDSATARGLTGPDTRNVRIADVDRVLRNHAASALEAASAPPGMGGEERQRHLDTYGGEEFEQLLLVTLDGVSRELEGPGETVAARARDMAIQEGGQQRHLLEEWAGHDY
jgi:hypothetical protein